MHAPIQPWALELPRTHADIDAIHHVRKRLAVERALQSKLLRPRLDGINLAKLDDPDEWRKIPVLTKDELRKLSTDEFYSDFCIAPISSSIEMWRSGGSTGKPLFYPRSAEDLKYNLGVAFRRTWSAIGAKAGDVLQCAFPMGIHPVGQMIPRSAQMEGISTIWSGAGNTTPTQSQIDLIRELKPTIFAAMPSYALHIANVAEAQGIDLAASSVKKVLVSAEPLTDAKRAKIERAWGAKVYNSLGMTEGSMTVIERDGVKGMVAWTDLFLLEVIDSATGKPTPEGEPGMLVMTPLWSNTITPFLRWVTGDIVTMRSQKRTEDPFSVFPVMEHTLRTEGFFKVRGVNLNHGDLEDFMFSQPTITDFRGQAEATDGHDLLRLQIEIQREANAVTLVPALKLAFKAKFELTPEIDVLETGTLASDFEKSIKAPRFMDLRK